MIKPRLTDEAGWISPEGDYYPCVLDPTIMVGYNHNETAFQIVRDILGLDAEDIDNRNPLDGVQRELMRRGWGRTGMEGVYIGGDDGMTAAQKHTLFKIWKMPETGRCQIDRDKLHEALFPPRVDSDLIPPGRIRQIKDA